MNTMAKKNYVVDGGNVFEVSALDRGRLAGISLDRLVRFLVLLGSDVEIVVTPRTRARGRARVMVA